MKCVLVLTLCLSTVMAQYGPGMNGMNPGMNRMYPGMNGMNPGMNRMYPGMNGMMPGMNGMMTCRGEGRRMTGMYCMRDNECCSMSCYNSMCSRGMGMDEAPADEASQK